MHVEINTSWRVRVVAGTISLVLLLTVTSEELDISCQTQRSVNMDALNHSVGT